MRSDVTQANLYNYYSVLLGNLNTHHHAAKQLSLFLTVWQNYFKASMLYNTVNQN